MTSRSVKVHVPGTMGNFTGDPSCGALALDVAMNVTVTLRRDGHLGVRYFGESGELVPRDPTNLIVRALETTLEGRDRRFSGADFEIYNSVPVGIGLGASTAAVWAGLIAADRLFDLGLEEKALLDLASRLDRRADNIRAAWFGGLECAGAITRRSAFPKQFSLDVIIPLIEGKSAPGLDAALSLRIPGAVVFVCGAGPAIGILQDKAASEAIQIMQKCLNGHNIASRHVTYHPSIVGAREWNPRRSEVTFADGPLADPAYKPTLIPV